MTSITNVGSTTSVPAASLVGSMTPEQAAELQLLTELQDATYSQGDPSDVQKFLNDLNSAIKTYGLTNADGSTNDVGQFVKDYGTQIGSMFQSMFALNSFSNSKTEADDAAWLQQYVGAGLGNVSQVSSFISGMLTGVTYLVPLAGAIGGKSLSTGDLSLDIFWARTTDASGNRVWPSGQQSSGSTTYTFDANGNLTSSSNASGLSYSWSQYSSLITASIMNGVNMTGLTGTASQTLLLTTAGSYAVNKTASGTVTGFQITVNNYSNPTTSIYTQSITVGGKTYSNLLAAVNDQYFDTYTNLVGNNIGTAYMLLMTMYDKSFASQQSGLSYTTDLLTEVTNNLVTPMIQMLQSMTSTSTITTDQAKTFASQLAMLQDLGQTTPAFSALLSTMQSSLSNLTNITVSVSIYNTDGSVARTDTTTLGAILTALDNNPSATTLPFSALTKADGTKEAADQTVTTSSSGMVSVFSAALTQLAQTNVSGTNTAGTTASQGMSQALINAIQPVASLFTQQSQQVSTNLSVVANLATQVIALGNSVSGSDSPYQQMLQKIINNSVVS